MVAVLAATNRSDFSRGLHKLRVWPQFGRSQSPVVTRPKSEFGLYPTGVRPDHDRIPIELRSKSDHFPAMPNSGAGVPHRGGSVGRGRDVEHESRTNRNAT